MFNDLIDVLEKNGKSIHAIQKCAEVAYERARKSGGQTAAWILLGRIAEDFVDRNERMAIMTDHTKTLYDQLVQAVNDLTAAYDSDDDGKKIAALDRTAALFFDNRI